MSDSILVLSRTGFKPVCRSDPLKIKTRQAEAYPTEIVERVLRRGFERPKYESDAFVVKYPG